MNLFNISCSCFLVAFIDLRYESEDLQGIEEKYNQWKSSYRKVMIWLHSLNIEKEDYEIDTVGGE